MTTPGSKRAPDPNSPTWAETPTRTDASPRPEFEARALEAVSARYDIVSELGRGGMGVVLQVRDRETDEIVALKLLQPDIAADPQWEKRFKDELRLARKITHKNVCRVYELLRFGDTAAIAMEYVEGETLRRVMRRFGGLPLRKAIAVMLDICSGLREAHAQGVVHRDLKPENVMIDEAGAVHIMDFGLARSSAGDLSSGASRGITGTPEYMSPEQASGKPADARSDIYALGLILYELLTGRAPFQGDSAVTIALKHVNEPPPSPRDLEPTIPHYVERAILKCLEKNPAKRFQTVEELDAALTTKQKVKEEEASEEIDEIPLPLYLVRWQVWDKALLASAALAIAVFLTNVGKILPYGSAQFMSPSQATNVLKTRLKVLGITPEVKSTVPYLSLLEYDQQIINYDWLSVRRIMREHDATGWLITFPPAVRGQDSNCGVDQGGTIADCWINARPPVFPTGASVEQERKLLLDAAVSLTGIEKVPQVLPGWHSADETSSRIVVAPAAGEPMTSVFTSVGRENYRLDRYRARWQGVFWGAIFAIRDLELFQRTLAVALVFLLFFVRRLHRRKAQPMVVGLSLVVAVLAFTGFHREISGALDRSLPGLFTAGWDSWVKSLPSDWQVTASGPLRAVLFIFVWLTAYCAITLAGYYGRRNDPARHAIFTQRSMGAALTPVGMALVRGMLCGVVLVTAYLVIVDRLGVVMRIAPSAQWLSLLISNGMDSPFYSEVVRLGPWTIAWRAFCLAAVEALALLWFLVALPAALVRRVTSRWLTVAAVTVLFWLASGYALSSLSTNSPVLGYAAILVVAPMVVAIFLRYDLLTAMAAVFTAQSWLMGYALYQTFRTLDSAYYLIPIAAWMAFAMFGVLACFHAQITSAMRRTARVFE